MKFKEKRMNKNAQASVLTVVLIIVLVFFAIIILWNILDPLLRDKSNNINTKNIAFSGVVTYSLYDLNKTLLVKIDRKTGPGYLRGVFITFQDINGKIYSFENRTEFPDELESTIYYFNSSKFDLYDFSDIRKVTLYFIYPLRGYQESKKEIGSSTRAITDVRGLNIPGCKPECDNKECGDNGCRGQCLPGCSNGLQCDTQAGRCVKPNCYNSNLNPVPICSCLDLQRINENLNLNYALQNNIDCSVTKMWNNGDGFIPLGGEEIFLGIFEGNKYAINDLYINSNQYYVGLFGRIGNYSIIKDLNLNNVNITAYREDDVYLGGLIGKIDFDDYTNITNVNCNGNISLDNSAYTGNGYVGGLIGSISGPANIKHSTFNGNINSISYSYSFSGGLIGQVNTPRYNITTVESSSTNVNINSMSITSIAYSGGLIGISSKKSTNSPCDLVINQSYSKNNIFISGSPIYSGGLIGSSYPVTSPVSLRTSCFINITNSYSITNITDYSGWGNCGGLISGIRGKIENSFSVPQFYEGCTQSYGLATIFYISTMPTYLSGYINNSYWNNNSLITDCYRQYTTSYKVNNTGCTSIQDNSDYFYTRTNPPTDKWDFGNIWLENSGDFPTLR